MIRRALAVALTASGLAAAALVTRCSDSGEKPDAADAHPVNDVRTDAGEPDGIGTEASVCVTDGAIHDWPGFTRIEALDPCCRIDSADDAGVLPSIEWIPCMSGRANCQEIKQTWRTDGIASYFGPFWVGKDTQSAPNTLLLTMRVDQGPTGIVGLYDFSTFGARAGWETGQGCALVVGPPSFPVDQDYALLARVSKPPYYRYAHGTNDYLAKVAAFTVISNAVIPDPEVLQEPSASSADLAVSAAYEGAILRIDLDSGTMAKGQIQGDALSAPLVIGDAVLAQTHVANSSGWAREVIVKPDGSVVVFREVANTHVAGFATDGVNLYWQESHGAATPYGGLQPLGEVWTAPLTSDPATLAATAKVLTANAPSSGLMNGVAFNGYYAIPTFTRDQDSGVYSSNGYRVVRASDGAQKFVAPANGRTTSGYVGYVSDTELWFVEDGPISIQSGIALVRVQYVAWP